MPKRQLSSQGRNRFVTLYAKVSYHRVIFFSTNLLFVSTQRNNWGHQRKLFLMPGLSRLWRRLIVPNIGQNDCYDKQRLCFSRIQVCFAWLFLGSGESRNIFLQLLKRVRHSVWDSVFPRIKPLHKFYRLSFVASIIVSWIYSCAKNFMWQIPLGNLPLSK